MLKSSLGQITSEDREHKDDYQTDVIKNTKNLYNSRQKILIYLMTVQKLDLKLFINQNKMKQ